MIPRNIISIILALLILYLSLSSSDSFDDTPLFNIPHIDKIVHFGMYFCFTSSIIFENRKAIKSLRLLIYASLIPFFYGIIMEVLQMTITTTRYGDISDALSNSVGVFAAALFLFLIRKRISWPVK